MLDLYLRVTLKRQGAHPIDVGRLRATVHRASQYQLARPKGYEVHSLRSNCGLKFDVVDRAAARVGPPATVVLYFHGGGYLFGSPTTHRQTLIAMARAFAAPVFGPHYRLAPEHRFPAAYDDGGRAYQWLASQHPKSAIVLAGDSAGAALALLTGVQSRDRGWKPPVGVVCFSPYADLAVTGDSVQSNAASCAMFTPRMVREAANLYLGDADPRDPRASPLYADLAGLPPILMFASQQESLRDDAVRLAKRATVAGVPVQLVMRERLPHAWPIFVPLLPESRAAFRTVAEFAHKICTA